MKGGLLGPARQRAIRHLVRCPDCLADLLAVRRGLAAIDPLPPPTYPHTLEEGLALPPLGPEAWKDAVVFFYVGFVNSAIVWTGLTSLWLFFRLTQVLTRNAKGDRFEGVWEAVDRLFYRFIIACGVGTSLWLTTTYVKQGWAPGHGELFSLALSALLAVHRYFRSQASGAEHPFHLRWRLQRTAVGAWLAALAPFLRVLMVETL